MKDPLRMPGLDDRQLEIVAHKSASYAPRTFHNARSADLTVAFAVDFSTRGEALTRRAAGDGRYISLSLAGDPRAGARALYALCRSINCKTLNVAGNSIRTLNLHGWSQEQCNNYIYDVLRLVCTHWQIQLIVSGGQTGADLAGGVAGVALDIPVRMTLPAGLLQRPENGPDRRHTQTEIIQP